MIHHGDNLPILQAMPPASVGLVYLDPPFNSGRAYGEGDLSFSDRWATTDTYRDFMWLRLVELHRVLAPTGTLYLHCDPTMSHHLRLLLDQVFDAANFRNEVVWRYRRWPGKAGHFQRMHDTLLVYGRSSTTTFHALHGYETLAPSTLATFGTKRQRSDFASGHRKPGLTDVESEGPPLSDVWEIGILAPMSKERTGYPTQKPEKLLERVILASSNPGDVVLDPFCGSGTTLAVAQRLGRVPIGIDQNPHAVEIARRRITTEAA